MLENFKSSKSVSYIICFHGVMHQSGLLLMHFKPFWMHCLHIKFFTSVPILELTAVENFTKWRKEIPGGTRPSLIWFLLFVDRGKWAYWIPSIRNQKGKLAYLMHRSKISENIELIGQIDAAAAPWIPRFFAAAPRIPYLISVFIWL